MVEHAETVSGVGTGKVVHARLGHTVARVLLVLVVALVARLGRLQGGAEPAGLRHRRDERPHARRALLRRRERLHAHLRPHARRQHGARLAVHARWLLRASSSSRRSRAARRLGLRASEAGLGDWIVPLVVASLAVGVIGLVMQQLFLRWNQGQDLRQALITIAISIIIADQTLAHFGGIADELAPPDVFPESVSLACLRASATRSSASSSLPWPIVVGLAALGDDQAAPGSG